jgi:hypothetical protein
VVFHAKLRAALHPQHWLTADAALDCSVWLTVKCVRVRGRRIQEVRKLCVSQNGIEKCNVKTAAFACSAAWGACTWVSLRVHCRAQLLERASALPGGSLLHSGSSGQRRRDVYPRHCMRAFFGAVATSHGRQLAVTMLPLSLPHSRSASASRWQRCRARISHAG